MQVLEFTLLCVGAAAMPTGSCTAVSLQQLPEGAALSKVLFGIPHQHLAILLHAVFADIPGACRTRSALWRTYHLTLALQNPPFCQFPLTLCLLLNPLITSESGSKEEEPLSIHLL